MICNGNEAQSVRLGMKTESIPPKTEENLESRLPAGRRVLLVPWPLSNKTFQC